MYLIGRSRCISRAIQDHHGPLVFNLFFPRVFPGRFYLKSNGRYQVIFSNAVHLSATSKLPIFGGNKLNSNPNKASQAIQFPRTGPLILLIALLGGYSFAYVHVKGTVEFNI